MISDKELESLRSMSAEVVRSACDAICAKEGVFHHILQMAVENRRMARSSFFSGPMGHYVWIERDLLVKDTQPSFLHG